VVVDLVVGLVAQQHFKHWEQTKGFMWVDTQ